MKKTLPLIALIEQAISASDLVLLGDISAALSQSLTPAVEKRAKQALTNTLMNRIINGDPIAVNNLQDLNQLQADHG